MSFKCYDIKVPLLTIHLREVWMKKLITHVSLKN